MMPAGLSPAPGGSAHVDCVTPLFSRAPLSETAGIPAACTVMLKSLGLPVNYVGLITTYRILTDNYGSACAISYNVPEEVEPAHKPGEIETDA